jgi:catechol 2,3-dioxygenase
VFELQHLDHVAITVADLARSTRWYCDVLGFEHRFPGRWDGVPVMLGLGDTLIALFPTKGQDQPWIPEKVIRVAHFALRSDRKNFLIAQEELEAQGIDVTFQDHDISHAIYFNDPDGHQLEITTYELE